MPRYHCRLCGNEPYTGHLCDFCTVAMDRDIRATTGRKQPASVDLAQKRLWSRDRATHAARICRERALSAYCAATSPIENRPRRLCDDEGDDADEYDYLR